MKNSILLGAVLGIIVGSANLMAVDEVTPTTKRAHDPTRATRSTKTIRGQGAVKMATKAAANKEAAASRNQNTNAIGQRDVNTQQEDE